MLVYCTTIWTAYHETICRELAHRLGDGFRLVLTESVDTSRNLGWSLNPPQESWIIPPPRTAEELATGVWAQLIEDAEVAVLGALYGHHALFRAADRRVASGRLTLFMGERPFKRGLHLKDFLRPYNWYVWWRLHRRYNRTNVHFLAIGNGVREDLKFLRVHKATIHPWAYFPALSPAPITKSPSEYLRICWCGRMIPCKHVEVLIKALALLPPDVRARCRAKIAGEGEMRETWMRLADRLGLEDCVSFLPMLPHEKVLELMAESDVYVFPSDGEEGWGVALEEAMDRCCVPLACREAGSPGALIEDGVTGFFFKMGDHVKVAGVIASLANNSSAVKEFGYRAWSAVQGYCPGDWAHRLITISGDSLCRT